MESMVSKTFLKVIGFFGSLFLTLCAGLWGMVSLCALFLSIIEGDLMNVIGCVAAGAAAWFCWSMRRVSLEWVGDTENLRWTITTLRKSMKMLSEHMRMLLMTIATGQKKEGDNNRLHYINHIFKFLFFGYISTGVAAAPTYGIGRCWFVHLN